MKRLTIILALLLMSAMPMLAEHVTPEVALKVATTFLNNNRAKADGLTDLSKATGFPNLYVFSTEESFVILSADDCVQPILGYSLTGKFVAEGMPENLVWWLKSYDEQIAYAAENGLLASEKVSKTWKELASGSLSVAKDESPAIAPLIETRWDQGNPYNHVCANGHGWITGCVATAMAQVLNYHEYPEIGVGSHSYPWSSQELSANFGATSYDWENMINTYTSGNFTQAQRDAVATLMYHCGVAVEMKYSTSASGSNIRRASNALQFYFNYNSYYLEKKNVDASAWTSLLLEDLTNGKPILYGGNVPGGGHAFVCDGYDGNGKFHFNWGWSGNNDGYFAIDATSTYLSPNGQVAAFHISPMTSLAIKPTQLEYTQTGNRNISLTWTAGEGAVSHNVYRNNTLIANTENSSYIDSDADFGTNTYYVRSIDENGNLSLPSNSINISINYPTPVVNDLQLSSLEDNDILSWTAPSWCFPETESEALAYVNRTRPSEDSYIGWGEGNFCLYWGHRYLAENLLSLEGKALYKVSFYTLVPGSFQIFLYQGTNSVYTYPLELVASQSITTSGIGWIDVNLYNPLIVDSSQDLWVFIHETEGKLHTIPCIDNTGISESKYYSQSNPNQGCASLDYDISWFIHTSLTDGTYTYHLYDNGVSVADDIAATNYTITTPADNTAHQYTVKTNYYGGETDDSNMAGITLGTASIASLDLGTNDQMTLTENSKLTVSGDVINTNPANLVLENGAQLIHNTADVQATVKKTIEPYTADDNGWYFIASPIAGNTIPSENNGFLNGTPGQNNNTYDLYYYDEPSQQWKNYESQSFVIENKKGYLYANGETNGTTLQFSGTLSPSNESITINNLSHSATILNGFNLVGNPFACNATINQDCYVIEGSQVVLATTAPVLAPCEGVMVKATNECSSVTFTKASNSKGNNSKDCFDLVVTQGKTNVDRARVRLNEGSGMEKFSLDDKHSQISLWQDGQDFAVAYVNGATEMPVNFKANKNGTYTLTLEAGNFDLDYLHLIDNLTGNDVDLLSTPSYTFEAKTTDYTSRFRLVFSNYEDTVGDNVTFAYVNNGDIVVNEEGTLQIVDMTGRVIVSRSGRIQCVPTTGMTPGVYVLRLINTDGVKTQKIVVE